MIEMSGELGNLRWKCRRGMLELDIVLLTFLESHYQLLTLQQKETFKRLLEEQDPVLQSWFLRQSAPQDKALSALVELILECREK